MGTERSAGFPAAPFKMHMLLLVVVFASACESLASAEESAYAPGGEVFSLLGRWQRAPAESTDADFDRIGEPVEIGLRSTPALPSRTFDALPPASYRRLVPLASSTGRDYALFIGPLAGIDSIRVDGQVLYSGPGDGTAMLRFKAAGPFLSIIVTTGRSRVPVRGYTADFERGNLSPRVLFFGDQSRVDDYRLLNSGISIFTAGYFLFIALFMTMLFLFWRKNREFLAFAFFAAASSFFYLVKDAAFLPFGLPGNDLAFHAALELQYASLALFLGMALGGLPRALVLAVTAAPLLVGALPFVFPEGLAWFHVAALSLGGIIALGSVAIALVRAFSPARDRRARWIAFAQLFPILSISARQFLPGSFAAAFLLEPAGSALFAFLCMLMMVSKIGDAFEEQETLNAYVEKVTKSLRRFIPREFLEALEKDRIDDLNLGDHVKKDMTIFFSDIRAFTELSERLTVEENFAFINSYLSRVVPLVTEHGGFIDKYIGDAIMALFHGENGPDMAIHTAVDMQKCILEYNEHRAKMGYVPIQMGVGIHSGSLMLGVVGVEDRMENTVISDSVNLASRLQAIAKLFNIGILISEQVFKSLKDPGAYAIRFMGKVRVKGKEAPVSTFEILDGLSPEVFERKTRANTFFEQGMISYYQKDYANSMYFFKRVIDAVPQDGAAVFYMEQCQIRVDRVKVAREP